MAQQLLNGSYRKGDVTVTIPMSRRYAVVGVPGDGKHRKHGAVAERKRNNWHKRQHHVLAEQNGYNRESAYNTALPIKGRV